MCVSGMEGLGGAVSNVKFILLFRNKLSMAELIGQPH